MTSKPPLNNSEAVARQLAALERELLDIANEIMRECGCHFIKI
jgi:hypothetical protein